MGVFLIVIGLGWAAMGVANIVMGLQNTGFGTNSFEAEWASLNLMLIWKLVLQAMPFRPQKS